MRKSELRKLIYGKYNELRKEVDLFDFDNQLWVYEMMYRFLNEIGFEPIWDSNQENSYISFAPTIIFRRGRRKVILSYSDVEVL